MSTAISCSNTLDFDGLTSYDSSFGNFIIYHHLWQQISKDLIESLSDMKATDVGSLFKGSGFHLTKYVSKALSSR